MEETPFLLAKDRDIQSLSLQLSVKSSKLFFLIICYMLPRTDSTSVAMVDAENIIIVLLFFQTSSLSNTSHGQFCYIFV